MVGQNYFNGGQTSVWGQTYTKYNKIKNNSKNFRGARCYQEGLSPSLLPLTFEPANAEAIFAA